MTTIVRTSHRQAPNRQPSDWQSSNRQPSRVRAPEFASAYRAALVDVAPMMLALLPFALAIGATASAIGMTLAETIAGAWLVLAGAAQLAAINQIGAETGILLTVTTAVIINLRFVLYGAGISRWFADRPRWQQLLLAAPVVDQSFLACEARFADQIESSWRLRYYLMFTAGLISAFTAGQVIGYGVGAGVPAGLGLHLAAPLVFAGMMAKTLSNRQNQLAAAVAAAVVVVGVSLPAGTALPVAIVAGAAIGLKSQRNDKSTEGLKR